MDRGLLQYGPQIRSLREQRDLGEDLIKNFLKHIECLDDEKQSLLDQVMILDLDLANATKSRRDLQQQVKELEAQMNFVLQDNDKLKNRNPYIVVLIDGDGLIFKESLILKGIDGGKEAAYTLRNAILEKCGVYASDVEVIAKVVANVSGLGKAMRRDGSMDNKADLRDFALGFTQCMASFDFVDIGHGKERADSKIKELTRWHLRNHNCKQIFLGVSHDAGYASFLDEMLRDDAARARISILEGFPTVRELKATGLNILNLTRTLFRHEKLVDRPMNHSSPPVASPESITEGPPTPLPTPVGSGRISYSTVARNASTPPRITLPLQPKSANVPSGPRQKSSWNPGPRGMDPSLRVDLLALEDMKKRRDGDKLCHNHYLRGPCTKGNDCWFEHNYQPTSAQKVAIAFLARQNPCINGQSCTVDDCIYGHHCPSTNDRQCQHPYCKFKPSEHPPGTTYMSSYSLNK